MQDGVAKEVGGGWRFGFKVCFAAKREVVTLQKLFQYFYTALLVAT